MTVYELTTNTGTYLVRCKPTYEQMAAYTTEKLKNGYKLSEILFCWTPVAVSESCNFIVEQAKRDNQKQQELKGKVK